MTANTLVTSDNHVLWFIALVTLPLVIGLVVNAIIDTTGWFNHEDKES